MRTPVFIALIVLWIAWFLPFALRRKSKSGPRPAATARISILGMVLQGAANAVVWSSRYYWTHPLEVWRVLAAVALVTVALLLVWSALPALGKQWRLQAGVYEDHELVQSGPYRFVRHPIYASMLAMLLAAGLLLASPTGRAVALVLMIAGIEIRVRAEDRLLAGRFGDRFAEYRARVPAYLPFIR